MPRRPKRGSPSKWTAKYRKAVIAATRKGLIQKYACAKARVSVGTFRKWIIKGEEDLDAGKDSTYAQFLADMALAEAEFLEEQLDGIADAGRNRWVEIKSPDGKTKKELVIEGQWTARAWLVERRAREYGRGPLEITGADGGAIDIAGLDALVRKADKVAKTRDADGDFDGGGSLDG